MTTSWHVPDPAQGAAIDALFGGLAGISMPNDDELVRAAIARLPAEMLADWLAFVKKQANDGLSARRRLASAIIPPASSTYDLDASLATTWTINSPSALGTSVFDLLNGEQDDEITFVVWNILIGRTIEVHRDGGMGMIASVSGASVVTRFDFKWLAGTWRLMGYTSDAPSSVAIGTA